MKNNVNNKEWKDIDKRYHEDGRVIASYDRRITRKYWLEHKYFTINNWIKKIAGEKCGLVLDFGCGTGTVTLRLLNAGIKTVSCDASLGMLKKLQEKAEAGNLKCICVVADAENLPFKDASFNALVCAGVLHHLPDIGKAVKEWLRVVKNQGLLFMSEPFKNRPWFSYIYWLPINIIRAIVKILRRSKLKTLEKPLGKEDLDRITQILKDNVKTFNIGFLLYWPVIAGYLPEFIGYPFTVFLNRINKGLQKGDSVIITARK